MHTDLDTLATALYVTIDDELKASPQLNRWRPKVGIDPKITDAELMTVTVMQALLGYHDEARWCRYARRALAHLFPYLPKQPGYNKRLRALIPQFKHIIQLLATATGLWRDPLRLADSTPVECGRSQVAVDGRLGGADLVGDGGEFGGVPGDIGVDPDLALRSRR